MEISEAYMNRLGTCRKNDRKIHCDCLETSMSIYERGIELP